MMIISVFFKKRVYRASFFEEGKWWYTFIASKGTARRFSARHPEAVVAAALLYERHSVLHISPHEKSKKIEFGVKYESHRH